MIKLNYTTAPPLQEVSVHGSSINFNWQPSGAGKTKQWDDETHCKQASSLIIQLKQTREWVCKLGRIRNFSGELIWLTSGLFKSSVLWLIFLVRSHVAKIKSHPVIAIKCTAMYLCGSSYFNAQRDGSAAEMLMKFYSSVFICQVQIVTPQLRRGGPRSSCVTLTSLSFVPLQSALLLPPIQCASLLSVSDPRPANPQQRPVSTRLNVDLGLPGAVISE